jgi:lipid-A-disaccharide synthase
MKSLKSLSLSKVSFRGLGGPLMEKQGLIPLENFDRLAVMGFIEVIKELSFFLKLKKIIVDDIKIKKPDKIILVDYPGFNLRLAKALSSFCSVPIIYYISPQFWAWKEKRITYIKKYITDLVVLFPFEISWYHKRNIKVHYFGHPLIDLYQKKTTENDKVCVGLFVGSRKQEINNHVPVIKEVVKLLQQQISDVFFIIGSLKNERLNIAKDLGLKNNYKIIYDSFNAFDESDVAIVASGTATLESAITKTPFVVIYKTSFISWFITRFFVKIKFASIVNILANKLIVKECLQKECNAKKITNCLLSLINNDNKTLFENFDKVINPLGDGTAYKQTANFLLLK